MGLTKQYLRFAPDGIFGVVASKTCNAAFLRQKPLRFVITGGSNVINLWDIRLQRKVRTLNCESPAVVVQPSNSGNKLAVGHMNGAVSIYDVKDLSDEASPEPDVTFEGHSSEITCLVWDSNDARIASGSKDTKVIVWDILSETGIVKLTDHKGMISGIKFWNNDLYLVTSSFDTTLRFWDMDTKLNVHTIPCSIQIRDFEIKDDIFIVAEAHLKMFRVISTFNEWETEELGTLLRQGQDRPSKIHIVEGGGCMLVVGVKSPVIEVFHLSSEEEAEKKRMKRLKKNPDDQNEIILRDLVRRSESLKASEDKIKSISAVVENETIKVLCCLPSNQLEFITFLPENKGDKKNVISETATSELLPFDGHRKLVRGIAFSSDKMAILTASGDCFKVWNRATLACILTIPIPHEHPVVCCSFCPGDRHFVAGSTDGFLVMADVSTGSITQTQTTGNENVWGIDVYENNMGFASCNGNFAQLFDFSMADGKLRFDMQKQLDVQDNVLSIKVSPNMKFVAVGLLDSTIKIFFMDTLKFHLSMYGHSLPVVGIDISSDNNLLVSCSGDKTVKVWGLDFGDCHCSMIHTDGLVGCSFLDRTHLVTSVAKDTINIYDADIHQRVQSIKAHVGGGATCMGAKGFYIASGGRDQTMRIFKRTQEILVLDDEREQEREEELEKDAKSDDPTLITLETAEGEKWADKVIEALQVFEDPDAAQNPLLQALHAKDSTEFLHKSLSQIKASELQQSLMMLPIAYVQKLVPALQTILESYPLATELVVRCLCALMKFHMMTMKGLKKEVLQSISKLTSQRLNDVERQTGINRAGLQSYYDKEKNREEEQIFREMVGDRKRKRKKRERAIRRAILQV